MHILRHKQVSFFAPYYQKTLAGFTLLEVLVAIFLTATALAITFSLFHTISKAWQRGIEAADTLNHGEFVMEQLVQGLRSAFFPSSAGSGSGGQYGFRLEDKGTGTYAKDVFSWVKTGLLVLNMDDPLSEGLHRLQVSVESDEDGNNCVAVRAWRPFVNNDDLETSLLPPFFITDKVVGMNCRVSTNRTDDGWQWQETWEDDATNHLPDTIELTLYMKPLEKNGEPVELKRFVEIPLAPLSWSKKERHRK